MLRRRQGSDAYERSKKHNEKSQGLIRRGSIEGTGTRDF